MRPGLSQIMETICIWRYFQSPETDCYIAENACCIDYADTCSLKRVHCLSKRASLHRWSTYYWCEDTFDLDPWVACASQLIMRIHPLVAPKSTIEWLPATLHNTAAMDHCEVRHGRFDLIVIIDPVKVDEVYAQIASCDHSLQCHVWSYGWRYGTSGYEPHSMQGRLVLHHDDWVAEAIQMFCWSDSKDTYDSHVLTYPWLWLEVASILEVGWGNVYESWQWIILYYPVTGGDSAVYGEWILGQTLTCTGQ
jgi:hypothetical protein